MYIRSIHTPSVGMSINTPGEPRVGFGVPTRPTGPAGPADPGGPAGPLPAIPPDTGMTNSCCTRYVR